MRKGQPVIDFLRPYSPDLVGWFRDFGQGAANYDANGHYARVLPIFGAFQFTENPAGGVLTPIPPSQRLAGLASGSPTAARAPPASRARRLRARRRHGTSATTATRATCSPGP